jgi:hypothetical protein
LSTPIFHVDLSMVLETSTKAILFTSIWGNGDGQEWMKRLNKKSDLKIKIGLFICGEGIDLLR